MKRLFEKAFTLPFKADKFGTYVFDAKNIMVIQFDDGFYLHNQEDILKSLNDIDHKPSLEFSSIVNDGEDIYIDDDFALSVRGWGHLTGSSGLNLSYDDATAIQDDLAKYIIERLSAE